MRYRHAQAQPALPAAGISSLPREQLCLPTIRCKGPRTSSASPHHTALPAPSAAPWEPGTRNVPQCQRAQRKSSPTIHNHACPSPAPRRALSARTEGFRRPGTAHPYPTPHLCPGIHGTGSQVPWEPQGCPPTLWFPALRSTSIWGQGASKALFLLLNTAAYFSPSPPGPPLPFCIFSPPIFPFKNSFKEIKKPRSCSGRCK